MIIGFEAPNTFDIALVEIMKFCSKNLVYK
jgi:hypothetical protein